MTLWHPDKLPVTEIVGEKESALGREVGVREGVPDCVWLTLALREALCVALLHCVALAAPVRLGVREGEMVGEAEAHREGERDDVIVGVREDEREDECVGEALTLSVLLVLSVGVRLPDAQAVMLSAEMRAVTVLLAD